jgi:hypothetical protein
MVRGYQCAGSILLAAAVVSAAGVDEARAADPLDSLIPFRIGNLTPFSAIVMDFAPTPASSVGKDRLVFSFDYSHANNFIMSENVETYLENCDPPTSLQHEDPSVLLGLEGATYLLDGEVGVLNLTGHYGVGARAHVSVTVPYINYTGGGLDGFTVGFHDTFGIGQNGRGLLEEDQFQLVVDLGEGNGSDLIVTDPPASGFGDPMLSFHYEIPALRRGWKLGFEVGVKIALSNAQDLSSTGSSDYGAQAALQKSWRRQAVVMNASFVRVGEFELLPGFEPADVTAFNVAWIHPLFGHVRGALQGRTSTSIFRDSIPSALADLEIMLSYGARWRFGNQSLGLAITENFVNHDSTSDVAFQLAYGISIR